MTDQCKTCNLVREAYAEYEKALEQREHGGVARNRLVNAVETALNLTEEWGKAVDESWAWFEKNLGRTPCSLDVQRWIDGYVPRS